jgi:DNA-binding CsgD family transcriptional regulator
VWSSILWLGLRVVIGESSVRRWYAAWESPLFDGRSANPAPMPAPILTACKVLLQEWRSELRSRGRIVPRRRQRAVQSEARPELSAHIRLMTLPGSALAEASLVISFRLEAARREDGRIKTSSVGALSHAEHQIVAALTLGLSNQEIADRLGKSVHAVKFALHRIYRRAGISNRTHLVLAMRRGQRR